MRKFFLFVLLLLLHYLHLLRALPLQVTRVRVRVLNMDEVSVFIYPYQDYNQDIRSGAFDSVTGNIGTFRTIHG